VGGALAPTAPAPSDPTTLRATLEHTQQPLAADAFVEAPADAAVGVRFSDGTLLRMAAGARARLVELGDRGAHVLLESGRARLDVVPKPHARWRMSAGPFLVRVKGTRFEVRWQPELDRFELELEQGQVELSGCVFGEAYRMRAGQEVRAFCKRGQLDVVREHAAASEQAKAAAVAAEPAPQPVSVEPATEPRAASAFEQRCERASSQELVRLADAARQAREHDREELALRVLRRRFPGTVRAAVAAFALGRLEFDVRREHRKAAEWFGRYLREQPAGALAREAHGRLIEAAAKAGDRARARSVALAYLRAYPDGPHVDLAESTLAASP
jgi:hypothetical protein